MGSPTLFHAVPAGVAPADGSFRRWSTNLGWLPVFEAQGFDVEGFEGAGLFTAIVHQGGHVGFGSFDGRTGYRVCDEARPSRPVAVAEARALLESVGRARYEARVAEILAEREVERGG